MNEVNFKNFFKNVKSINKLPPIPKDLDTKHLQEFIKEFEKEDNND